MCASRSGRIDGWWHGRAGPATGERSASEWDARGFDDFPENGLGLRRFSLRGGVARVHRHAMDKDWQHELLKIVRQAEVPPFDECAGLRRALQHERAARAYAEREPFALARLVNDLQRVVEQAVFHAHLLDLPLHGQHV